MKPEEREPDLDQVLDQALARYSDVEPRAGLEERILANLRSQPQPRPWWMTWRMPALAAAILVAALVAYRVTGRVGESALNTAMQQTAGPAQPASTQPAAPASPSSTSDKPAESAAKTFAVPRQQTATAKPHAVAPHLLADKSANRIRPQGLPMLDAVASAEQSCREFAQSFYDWYVPATQAPGASAEIVTQRKAALLSPSLLRALSADFAAQARAKGELVGLDFDPFVGSQDPADHYTARNTKVDGDDCLVEVWRDSPNDTAAKSNQPEVVAELANADGRWRFVNFRYPAVTDDLLSTLKRLRQDRSSIHH